MESCSLELCKTYEWSYEYGNFSSAYEERRHLVSCIFFFFFEYYVCDGTRSCSPRRKSSEMPCRLMILSAWRFLLRFRWTRPIEKSRSLPPALVIHAFMVQPRPSRPGLAPVAKSMVRRAANTAMYCVESADVFLWIKARFVCSLPANKWYTGTSQGLEPGLMKERKERSRSVRWSGLVAVTWAAESMAGPGLGTWGSNTQKFPGLDRPAFARPRYTQNRLIIQRHQQGLRHSCCWRLHLGLYYRYSIMVPI